MSEQTPVIGHNAGPESPVPTKEFADFAEYHADALDSLAKTQQGIIEDNQKLHEINEELSNRLSELEKQNAEMLSLLRSRIPESTQNKKGEQSANGSQATNQEKVSQGEKNKSEKKEDVAEFDLGDYPELYARRKNLIGGEKDALEGEAEKLSKSMAASIDRQLIEYMEKNPSASPEEIRSQILTFYVSAQNRVQTAVIDAVDGKGYKDAEGNEKGKSRLRRFGSWLDRHGSKLKIGMLTVGAVGAVAMTGGVLAGVFAPAFALGTGTVVGVAKGIAVGLGMSRHGSKESASRDINNEVLEKKFAEMSDDEIKQFSAISTHIMSQFNTAADKDHKLNVKKSAKAATIGAVLGGLAGSLSFDSSSTELVKQTVDVPNPPPELPSHTIQPGELTGHIIQNTLREMGLSDGDRFVMPDGSTNLDAIYEYFTPEEWYLNSELSDGTHAVEGANSLSNEGIRHIIQSIVNSHDWGNHTESVETNFTEINRNWPATIAGWISSGLLTAATARQIADSTKKSKEKVPETKANGSSQPLRATGAPSSQESSQSATSETSSSTYKFGEKVESIELGKTYGLIVYGGIKPVEYVGKDKNSYVFKDLADKDKKEIRYSANQMDGENGWISSGRFKPVIS